MLLGQDVAVAPLAADLRRALDEREFRLHFQPIVSLKSHRIAGFEALLRWEAPGAGLQSPHAFLPAAEETGLIVPIGLWVLEESCRRLQDWQTRYPEAGPLFVAVNLSARQFEQPDLVDEVRRVLRETGLPGTCLKLEITETLVMHDAETARAMLLQLRALDVRLAIDDFGTGYSSLAYLRKFPVHTLKIDRSFVAALDEQKENLEIARAIVTLARNLGLDVVAEGVETTEQLGLLTLLECDYGQGYLLSRPVDAQRAEALLAGGLAARLEALLAAEDDADTAPVVVTAASPDPGPPPVRETPFAPASSAASASASAPTPASAPAPAPAHAPRPAPTARPPRATGRARTARMLLACAGLVAAAAAVVTLTERGGEAAGSLAPPAGADAAAPRPSTPDALEQARAALAAGRLVLPAGRSAVFYSNQRLAEAPQDGAARALREQAARRALELAGEKARAGRPEDARRAYGALVAALRDDATAADLVAQAQQGLRDVEFSTVAVTHDHFVGGCPGQLRVNAYTIGFAPQDGGKHAFSVPRTGVAAARDGKLLRLEVAGRAYRFKSADGNAAALDEVVRRLAAAGP